MTPLLHITPQLPPAICGVGDYAALVGGRIEELFPEVRCGYVAAGHRLVRDSGRSARGSSLWKALAAERDRLHALDQASAAAARGGAVQSPPAIVLHYSGYGYSPDGAPAWLADALENRPAEWRESRIVTFFHELYATGWPWTRAFWQSSRQRQAAIRIARASDALMTNREQSARWLEEVTGRPAGSVPHLPVPSNVGEPEVVPAYEDRPPHAVVFGGAAHKRKFLTGRGARRTAATCRRLGITRLTDIGAPCPVDRRPFDKAGVEVMQTGYLPKAEVSSQLLDARVGFADVSGWTHEKSGVLAAYAAHGVLTFTPTTRDPIPADTAAPLSMPPQSFLSSAWYAQHDLSAHAAVLKTLYLDSMLPTSIRIAHPTTSLR